MAFAYHSSEEIRPGDLITFHGDSGTVEFVISSTTGDATRDWYLEKFPGGGVMIVVENWGHVFLNLNNFWDEFEDLDLVSRKP
jgi:hypothetical protein